MYTFKVIRLFVKNTILRFWWFGFNFFIYRKVICQLNLIQIINKYKQFVSHNNKNYALFKELI